MIELVSQCLEQKVYKHKINIAFMSYTAKKYIKKLTFHIHKPYPPCMYTHRISKKWDEDIYPNDKYDSIFIKGDVDHILNKMR